ncbi:MAG: hypothetical protein ACM3O3_06135 [Syntrophothermus sp.]|nr:hypothetical protein [Ignavibacteriaceae bacterium]
MEKSDLKIRSNKSRFALLIAIIAAIIFVIWLIVFFDKQDEGKNKSGYLIKQITEKQNNPLSFGDSNFRNYKTLKT